MNKRINVSIIGAGRIAEHHLKAIKKIRGFKLCAICDLNYDKAYEFSKKYKVPYYLDYNEMLNKEKNIDLISNSLESIHDMIINIREDLKNINIKIGKHKDKWFNRWRSIDVRTELVNLKLHCDVLDKRFNLMTKSIKIV